jgi:putative transposase
MTIPFKGSTGIGTYFVTASSFGKQSLLQSKRMAELFIDVLLHYQKQEKYLLHEYVVMPDHFHLLVTPIVTLEKAVQYVKGGFSYRARRDLKFKGEVWQTSFYDHRVRDATEYGRFRHYIHMNPVRRGIVWAPEEFSYSSVRLKLDEVPQWLKPAA